MDPNTTYTEMLGAMANGDYALARERAASIIGWLEGGGFPPVNHTKQHVLNYASSVLQRTMGVVKCACEI